MQLVGILCSSLQDLAQVDTSCQDVVDIKVMTAQRESCLSTLSAISFRIPVSTCINYIHGDMK